MAEKKTIELEIKSNLADAEKSLGSLKSQLRNAQAEVASLSDKFGATSKEAVAAAKNAAILADKIGDAKALTDAFNPDAKFKALSGSLNGIAGGFSVVTGVMGTLGTESKDVEQAILKVQSAMAIASGAQAIGESVDQFRQLGAVVKSYAIVQKAITAGQWLWNAAMAANPIGLLVAGVAALVAGGVALTNYFMSNAKAAKINTASINANKTALKNQSKTADSASKSLQINSDYQLAMAKASGASTVAIRKLELKLIDEKIAFANSSREIAKNTYHKNLNALASLKASDADEEQIKSQEEITRKSLEEFGKQTKNLNDANAEKGNIIRKQNVEIRQEQANHNNEVTKVEKKEGQTRVTNKKETNDELDKLNQERLANEMQSAKDAIAILESLKPPETPAQKEYREYLEKKAILEANNLDTKKLTEEFLISQANAELAIYEDKLAKKKEKADKELEIDKQVADAKKTIQEGTFNNISAGIGLLKGLFEKNKGLQKALLIAESAAGIAKIIINTRAANAAAKLKYALLPGGVALAAAEATMNNVSAGIGIASTIAATAKGLSAFGGGGAPSSGGAGGSEGGGGATPTAPAFNVVGASATNQIAQTIANQQQQPIKAYVVSNDVTTAQSLDRNIISSASIG